MILKRIRNSVIFVIMFFVCTSVASADLEITEVNYNPKVKTDHLWIKVYNNTNEEINLTEWSVADYDGSSWHYHTINATNSQVLNSMSYAIIAKASSSTVNAFEEKNPDISEPLFYGNLTIKDEGVLGLSKDKKVVISNTPYGPSDTITDDSSGEGDTDNEITEPGSSGTVSKKSVSGSSLSESVFEITTKIISPKIVTAGIPFTIDHQTFGVKKEKVILGKFIWNFGDGIKRESYVSNPFEYVYQYPGDYVLTLSFYDSGFDLKPDTVDRITIKAIPSGLAISSVGTVSDPYIEIENNSNYEMSLYNWIIKGKTRSFIIPEGLIILPNKKLKLSPRITGFDFNDLNFITIVDSSGQIFATYPSKNLVNNKYIPNKNYTDNFSKIENTKNNQTQDSSDVINLNDLSASAVTSGGFGVVNKSLYFWLGLIFIILIGVMSIILIRRKEKQYPDYVEKEISADDITILE